MRARIQFTLGMAALLALTGCSSNNEARKEETKSAPKNETAPDVFRVNLDTSKGPVAIEVHRDWAPIGVDHLYTLVKLGFYDGARFFRVLPNFVVQFGINGDPKTNRMWADTNLLDDPVKQSNVKGTVTYATAGPNTRATELFINVADNARLDRQGFAPIGKVIEGMDNVGRFYFGYGEMPPRGHGPDPAKIQAEGNAYLDDQFPRLDYIRKATIQ